MIRLGIVGCNYGRNVLLPAFRADPRCAVVALAGSDQARTQALASESGVPRGFGDWSQLITDDAVDAIAIATPPSLQPEIAIQALRLGKPVFAEKPLAADLASARMMLRHAMAAKIPTMIDFEFPELTAWRHAKMLLDQEAIGELRHAIVTWNVENYATRMHLRNWKTLRNEGGGVLGNFVSHCFHYLEWFCSPIAELSARLFGPAGADSGMETTAMLTGSFASGAGLSLMMSCASYLGSGHRIEFYGEDGTLVLVNTTADYMRGFELFHARRPAATLARVEIPGPAERPDQDGRIAPVTRLAGRFLDAIEQKTQATPNFADGYRVQCLLDATRRANDRRRQIDIDIEENRMEMLT